MESKKNGHMYGRDTEVSNIRNENRVKGIALVSGSYDPFTNGHLEIVRQAAAMFDAVHVVIFSNSSKKRKYYITDMVEAIKKTLADEKLDNCIATSDDGLLARYCMRNGILYNVRGLRDNLDYGYEVKLSTFNTRLYPELRTVYLQSGNTLSSTDVRELRVYNEDITPYVPRAVAEAIENFEKYVRTT